MTFPHVSSLAACCSCTEANVNVGRSRASCGDHVCGGYLAALGWHVNMLAGFDFSVIAASPSSFASSPSSGSSSAAPDLPCCHLPCCHLPCCYHHPTHVGALYRDQHPMLATRRGSHQLVHSPLLAWQVSTYPTGHPSIHLLCNHLNEQPSSGPLVPDWRCHLPCCHLPCCHLPCCYHHPT